MLIDTKLHIPPLKHGMVVRKHLIERLYSGKGNPLFLISGPAGAGKTSLICQWLAREKLKTAWYSIDSADNDPDIFFRYLLTSLIHAENRLISTAGPLLQDMKKMSAEKIIPVVIQALLTLKKDIYLILDDYHHITDKEIQESLHRLVQYMPPRLHIVMLSRHSLKGLFPRLRLQQRTVDISPVDLAFTENEVKAFFSKIMPVDLSGDHIRELMHYVEGWAAGFQLIALSLDGKTGFSPFDEIRTEACHGAIDYLMNEVVNAQPEKIKNFLFKTALLDRFNEDAAKEITCTPDAFDIMEDIKQKNLFLMTLDARQHWYRYHHLFSDAIREQVRIFSPEKWAEVHCAAALWFAGNSYFEDAFQHAFLSENLEFTADLMEDYLLHLFELREVASSQRWLSKLPRDVFLKRPLLRLIACCLTLEQMNPWSIADVLQDLEEESGGCFDRYDPVKKNICMDLLIFLKYARQYFEDPIHIDPEEIDNALEKISGKIQNLCGYMKLFTGISLIHQIQLRAAEVPIKEASRLLYASESRYDRTLCSRVTAFWAKFHGRLHQARRILEDGLLFLDQNGSRYIPLKFLLYLPMAEVSYEFDELDKAMEYVTINQNFVEQAGIVDDTLQGAFLMSRLYLISGEMEKSVQYRQKMQAVSKATRNAYLIQRTEAQTAMLALYQGEIDVTERWARKRKLRSDEPLSSNYIYDSLTHSLLFFYQRHYEKARVLMESLQQVCAKQNYMEFVFMMDISLACISVIENNPDSAGKALEKALSFSETQGYIRPYIGAGPLILPLLQEISETLSPLLDHSHLSTVIDACKKAMAGAVSPNSFTVKKNFLISPREIEILELMAAGYKDREIAQKAYISLNTVKTHAKNIYEKLNVQGRIQAVLRAKELKLFEKA